MSTIHVPSETGDYRPRHYRRYRLGSWLALIASFLFFLWVALLTLLNFYFLPRAQDFFDRFATTLKKDYGMILSAQSVSGELSEWHPLIVIEGFHLLVNAHSAPITAKRLRVDLSWQWMIGQLQFRDLQFDEVSAQLMRDQRGSIRLQGRGQDEIFNVQNSPSSMDNEGWYEGLDWLLRQQHLAINRLRINWQDYYAPALIPPQEKVEWQIAADVHLEKASSGNRLIANINLPEQVAQLIKVEGQLRLPSARQWFLAEGELQAQFQGVQGQKLLYFLPEHERLSGHAQMQLWWQGQGLMDSRLVVDAVAEDLQWSTFPLMAKRAQGRIVGRWRNQSLLLDLRSFLLSTDQGRAPLPTLAQVDFSPQGMPWGGALYIPNIDLTRAHHLVKQFVQWFPEITTINALSPQGELRDNIFKWQQKEPNQALDYRYYAVLHEVGWRDYRSIPGVSGLSGQVLATPQRGQFYFSAHDLRLHLPHIMWQAEHQVDHLSGTLQWSLPSAQVGDTENRYRVEFNAIEFANADGEVSLNGYFEQGGKFAQTPTIDIAATLLRADGRQAWRYMPKAVKPEVGQWLKSSIIGAYAPLSILTLRGDLRRFPFEAIADLQPDDPEVFQVLVPFNSARLQFQEGWPAVEDSAGLLVFNGPSMNILVTRGFLSGADAQGTTINIDRLANPLLTIKGTARGDIHHFRDFLLHSPLQDILPNLRTVEAEGKGDLQLTINMPLDQDLSRTSVQGSFHANTPALAIGKGLPPLNGVNATVDFDDRGVIAINAQGQWLNASLTMKSTAERGVVRASMDGLALEAVKMQAPFRYALLQALQGEVSAEGVLKFRDEGVSGSFTADLQALQSKLPAPWAKNLQEDWKIPIQWEKLKDSPLSLSARLNLANASTNSLISLQKKQDRWDLQIVDLQKDSPFVTVDKEPHQAEQGLFVSAQMSDFDLAQWLPFLSDFADPYDTQEAFFQKAQLSCERLRFGGVVLSEVQASINKVDDVVLIDYSAPSSQGVVKIYTPPIAQTSPFDALIDPISNTQVEVNINRLALDPLWATPSAESSLPSSKTASERLPKLSINIDELMIKQKSLGKLSAKGTPTAMGYQFKPWNLRGEGFAIDGEGESNLQTGQTQINFSAKVRKIGNHLTTISGKESMQGGDLTAQGLMSWAGGWSDFALEHSQASAHFSMDQGRFLQIDPGVGRLLGLLSLQSIFRRITFDFSDTIKQGFSFDNIKGDFQSQGAVWSTQNLTIESPAAKVFIQGQINLVDETQNLEMLVLPDIGGGLASGIAFFVNPVTGVATWIAQKVLGTPFDHVFARKLAVSGTWADPQVKEIPYIPQASDHPQPFITEKKNATDAPFRHPDGFVAQCR